LDVTCSKAAAATSVMEFQGMRIPAPTGSIQRQPSSASPAWITNVPFNSFAGASCGTHAAGQPASSRYPHKARATFSPMPSATTPHFPWSAWQASIRGILQ